MTAEHAAFLKWLASSSMAACCPLVDDPLGPGFTRDYEIEALGWILILMASADYVGVKHW